MRGRHVPLVEKKLSSHWEGSMPGALFWSGLKPVPTSGYTVFLSQRCIFFILFPKRGVNKNFAYFAHFGQGGLANSRKQTLFIREVS